ncbi:MAG: type II secretion system protein GspC [Nitrospirota bacterium]
MRGLPDAAIPSIGLFSMIWYHWRQHLTVTAVLIVAAYLVADLATLFMGASLEASMPPQRRPAMESPSLPTSANTETILRGNLFHPEQRGNWAATQPAAPPPVPLESTHRLVGTVIGSGSFGFAVLEEKTSKAQLLYRIDDLLPGGAQLIGIERYAAVIQLGGATHRLAIEEDVPVSSPAGATPAAGGGVRELAANHWLIERRKVEAALDNLPQLLTQARLIPNFSGGKADGFRLVSIKANSFFSDIGLQDGDVLQRINGIEVKDPQNMLKAFGQLRNEANINLDLQRRSQPVTLAYEIR